MGSGYMRDEKGDKKGFVVEDRRRFSSTGDLRSVDFASDSSTTAETNEEATPPAPPELTFSGFVVGLAQQAFVSLGLAPDPQTDAPSKDLAQAKAMIDVLSMLRDKTRGNLDEVESRMMDDVLDELRLRYVREVRESRKDQGGRS